VLGHLQLINHHAGLYCAWAFAADKSSWSTRERRVF
jgi:hypothetical protein